MTLRAELESFCTPSARLGAGWLAPQVAARAALALRSIGADYRVVSTARSNEVQARLYERYRKYGGPPAAPPGGSNHNPGLAGRAPLVVRVGGFTEAVPRDGWAIAVDAGPKVKTTQRWRTIEAAMLTWGMWLTVGVSSRNADGSVRGRTARHEPWHFQPMTNWQPGLGTFVLYVAERIRSLPGAPDTVEADKLMAWFRAFALGRPFDTRPVTQEDLNVLGAVEAFLGSQNRRPLP